VSGAYVPPANQVPVSGFPLRIPGESARVGRLEVATAYRSGASPAGDKPLVIHESRGAPGVLRYVWMAIGGNGAEAVGAMEDEGFVRIYIDDEATPVVDVAVADFFCYGPEGGAYATPRIGRTKRHYADTYKESGAYRYLFMPFQRFCRVEYVNRAEVDCTVWAMAGYSSLTGPYQGNQQVDYRVLGAEDAEHPSQTPLVLCDVAGAGQVESVWVRYGGGTDNPGIIEGNLEIWIDDEAMPRYISTGGEDWVLGAFGTVPVGGYPAGRCGDHPVTGPFCWYRFHEYDPIFFSTRVKVVWNVGQAGQGTMADPTVPVGGFVGLWLNEPRGISYRAPGEDLIVEDFGAYGPGDLASPWAHPPFGSPNFQGGGGVATLADAGAADRYARRTVASLDHWLETKVRITGADDGAEAFLFSRGATEPFLGDRLGVMLRRDGARHWLVAGRDGSATTGIVKVDEGHDLTGVWVWLALLVRGTTVTAYWRRDGATAVWQPVCSWTTERTGNAVGIGTWSAEAEFDLFQARQLVVATS
jgi:hypothetical protein